MISTRLPAGHADDAGGGQQRRWRHRWPGCPTGPPTRRPARRRSRCARPGRRGGRRSTTAPALLSCSTSAMAPLVLGLGDLRLDEVDQHLVEQPAHLDDGDVAVVRRPGPGAASAAAGDEGEPGRTRRLRRPDRPSVASSVVDPARFFAASRLLIVAGKGGVGKTVVSATVARAAARVGPVDPGHRGGGQVGPAHDVRPVGPRLRRRGARAGRRADGRGRGAGPHPHARRGAARLPPRPRAVAHLEAAGVVGRPRRGGHRRARDQGHPHPRQGEAARAGGRRRPPRARRPGRRARHHLPAVGQRAARHRAGRARSTPRRATCSRCSPTTSAAG